MKSFIVSTKDIYAFRKKLLAWYRAHGRDLPWRKTHDPYHILVSEVMLQQTQVNHVIEKYNAWLEHFPTVQDLAKASPKQVLQAWSGLGYNRRALALHTCAQQIVEQHNGTFPNTVEELMQFKGIGKYTASAIVAFAFKKPVPIVDTNVKRVLGRIFFGYKKLAQFIDTNEPFWELKAQVVPNSKNSYDFNQGIMDFGALICTAKQPSCSTCPIQRMCTSYPEILEADPELLRVKKKRTEPLYFGKPRRIWRGLILHYLKQHPNTPTPLTTIGKAIQPDWKARRLTWLTEVIKTLENDKLITIQRTTTRSKSNTWKIMLPE